MHKYSNCFAMLRCGAQPYGTVRLIELSEMVGEHLLHAALLLRLLHNRIEQLEERLAVGADWNPHQLVFVTTTGNGYARTNWRKQQYVSMIQKAGLPYIRPHDLR